LVEWFVDNEGDVHELLLVSGELLLGGASEDLGSSDSLLLDGGEASGEDGLTDKGDGHTHVEGVDGGPLSGTLLAGLAVGGEEEKGRSE
jgi:hypothetical protein